MRSSLRFRWVMYMASMLLANFLGAILVFAFIRYGLPMPLDQLTADQQLQTSSIFATYLVFAAVVSLAFAARNVRIIERWRRRGGPPTRVEQMAALHAPLRQAIVHLGLWAFGSILFLLLTIRTMPSLALAIVATVLMAATSTFGFTYMLGERILRPLAARALSQGRFDRTLAPGVGARMLMTWGMGTAVPATGIVMLALVPLTTDLRFDTRAFALAVLALALLAMFQALVMSLLTTGHIADPIRQLGQAISMAQKGADDVSVEIFDGSAIGRLQVGFNRMMEELGTRRQLRELFGRHVGEEVARRALQSGTELGGETRFVAVLFVDMIGSTAAAAERPPNEVVDTLNELFRVVVDVVDRHNGFVNKFVGDAALAIFGAPLNQPDAPTEALAAARELRRVLIGVKDLDVGIGVSAGLAVAGNIGSAERFEYTVIGDPVNEASRLTELAKLRPGRVLASSSALYFADEEEAAHWTTDGEKVRLRGRRRPTSLVWPTDVPESPITMPVEGGHRG